MSKLRALRITTVIVTLLGARAVAADISRQDTARANNLFEAGQKLIEAGQIELACQSFEASFAIDPQQGTRLNLADCRERQGRLLEAYELFMVALDEAARSLKSSRLKFAQQRVSALARKLVEIEVAISTTLVEGLEIKVDGRVVPRERWMRVLREPSKIVIDAAAPGRAPFHAEVVGTAGARVVVEIPALAPLAVAPARAARDVRAAPRPALDLRASKRAENRRGLAMTPLFVGGAGSALAVGGIVLGLRARSHYREELASSKPDLDRRIDAAQREADIATAMGIAGTVAIVAGIVIHIRGRRDRVVVTPTASSTSAGLALTGTL